VQARYRYHIYPNYHQRQALAKLFGCVRVDALAICRGGKYLGFAQLCRLLAQSKKTEERRWLSDVSCVPLSQAIRQLDAVYQNFFNSCQGKRVGPPRLKKKANRQSATFTKAGFSMKEVGVYLAKIDIVKPIWSRPLPSEPTSVTVIKDPLASARGVCQHDVIQNHGAGT